MNNLPDELIIRILKNLNICKYVENLKINSISKNINHKLKEITKKCNIAKKVGFLYCKNHILLSLQIKLLKNIKYFFLTDFK